MPEALLAEEDLWIGEMRAVTSGPERLLVVRLETGVCVYRDRCPHQGQPLSDGKLEQGIITCRVHQHRFDAATGAGVNPRGSCLKPLRAFVEAGQVWLDVRTDGKAAP